MKYAVDFEGYIFVEAKNHNEAQSIFLEWVNDIEDNTLANWRKVILTSPAFECNCVEEED